MLFTILINDHFIPHKVEVAFLVPPGLHCRDIELIFPFELHGFESVFNLLGLIVLLKIVDD